MTPTENGAKDTLFEIIRLDLKFWPTPSKFREAAKEFYLKKARYFKDLNVTAKQIIQFTFKQ